MPRSPVILVLVLLGCTSPAPIFEDAGPGMDAGDPGTDAGHDAGVDAGPGDAGPGDEDAGVDAGPEDAGVDAGPGDAGPTDAGPCPTDTEECDGDPAVFCETDLTQPATCGSCENACPGHRPCVDLACAAREVIAVSPGSEHTCALLDDGLVYCWGRDHRGQLGDGSTPEDDSDNRANPVPVVDLMDGEALAAGGGSACAIRTDGSVRCWGHNNAERYGDGTHAGVQPSAVDLASSGLIDPVLEVDHTDSHLCVRTASDVLCAGSNLLNQLGRDTPSRTPIAEPVEGLPFDRVPRSIAVGFSSTQGFTLVALDDGSVWCVGGNDDAECGQTASTSVPAFAPVAGLSDIVQVEAGFDFACALDDTGRVFCWGSNSSGRQGNGTTGGPDVVTPTQVMGLPPIGHLAIDFDTVLAVTADGTAVWGWGDNGNNQLGLGPGMAGVVNTPTPAIVDATSEFTAWGAGSTHSCILQERAGMPDAILCAGNNSRLALGMDPAPDPMRWNPIVGFP